MKKIRNKKETSSVLDTPTAPKPSNSSLIQNRIWIGLILIGVALRISGLFNSLEYDEIWTMENFAPKSLPEIFTDLALPNNHPLNTLGVKLCITCFNLPYLIRLPALLASFGSLLLFPIVAFLWTQNRRKALIAFFFFTFSHMAIGYATQARGYELQLFFLLLFSTGLQLSGHYRPQRYPWLPETLVFLGGAGAVLTLPTSILYLAPIALIGIWNWWKNPFPCAKLKAVLATGIALTAGWYLMNYHALRAAQVWGAPIKSINDFFSFVGNTSLHLNGYVVLALAIISIILCFQRSWMLLVIIAVPFLSAIATNAGGVRVYLPMVVPGALLAGMGVDEIIQRLRLGKNQIAIAITALICLTFLADWYLNSSKYKAQNWYNLYEQIHTLPTETMIALDAGDGFPYTWNNSPVAYKDYDQRLRDMHPHREIVSFLPPNLLNGTDQHGASQEFHLNLPSEPAQTIFNGFKVCHYRLEEVDIPPESSDLLLILRPLPVDTGRSCIAKILEAYPSALVLNPWLAPSVTLDNIVYRGWVFIFHCNDPGRLDWNALRRHISAALAIYQIHTDSEKNEK